MDTSVEFRVIEIDDDRPSGDTDLSTPSPLYEALLDALPLREFESELFPRSILENFELEIQFLELRIFYIYII